MCKSTAKLQLPGLLACMLLAGCQGEPESVISAASNSPALGAFAWVTVGVSDLDAALSLWRDQFALEVIARRDGPDAELAGTWGIDAGQITRQALLRAPGVNSGALHLVEFGAPGAPVRAGAAVFDRLPKNLDVYARDLPDRYEELQAAGFEFRSAWVEMPAPGGSSFREAQMAGHDETNIVLVEVLGTDYLHSAAGYAGIGPLVLVVGDADAETRFYQSVLGLQNIMEHVLAGPKIESMVGLPAGAGIDFRVLGAGSDPMGRIEVIEYQRAAGEDRYGRARPPATGILHAGWQVEDLESVQRHLRRRGLRWQDHGRIAAVYGSGRVISLHTPAGFRIEIQELASPWPRRTRSRATGSAGA